MQKQPKTFLSLRLIHWMILLASVALTVGVWGVTSYQNEKINQAKFDREVTQVVSLIQERMEKYVDALQSGAAYIKAVDHDINIKSWRKFADRLMIEKKYPGINGIGVVYALNKKDVTAFEERQRSEGNPIKVYPEHGNDIVLPIVYIEPLNINKQAHGLDVAHENNRLEGAMQAAKSGNPTITAPIVLVQDDKKTPGFLLYVPLYENEHGSKKLLGFVYAPFIVYKLMDGALAQELRYVHVKIDDDGQEIYHDAEIKNQVSSLFESEKKINVYGRTWTIWVTPTQQFLKTLDVDLPNYILMVGCTIDLSLLIIFIILARSHRKAVEYGDQLTEELKKLAHEDSLTELPNRMAFVDAVLTEIEDKKIEQLAVLYLDLDDFKNVNDSLGHSVGDDLLMMVAKRIQSVVLQTTEEGKSKLGRLGGDEFAILVVAEAIEHVSQAVARQIIASMDENFQVGAHDLHINSSIGVATARNISQQSKGGSEIVRVLLMHADIAMYDAKSKGKNQFALFNDELLARTEKNQLIELYLYNSIASNQLSMEYEPIFYADGKSMLAVEALVRWYNPLLGNIGPAEFIPIAEKTNFIIKLSYAIFEMAFRQKMEWIKRDHPYANILINLNCSAIQLEDKNFHSMLTSLFERYPIGRSQLVLEITETALMKNIENKLDILRRLSAEGIQFAIDDFGTGYSSLNYLELLPVSFLKIDQSFIARITDTGSGMIENIIKISHSTHIRVIAEGVETEEQFLYLQKIGCDYLQGFYFKS